MNPSTSPREILVVREGAGRIAWQRVAAAFWEPIAVWPGPAQAAAVREHLATGGRVLVLLDESVHPGEPVTRVAALAEELAGAAPEIRALCDDDGSGAVDLCLPLLDWLPEDLRADGLRTVESLRGPAGTAGYLTTAVIDDRDDAQIRYVRLTTPRAPSGLDLDTMARLAFPGTAAETGLALALRVLTGAAARIDLTAGHDPAGAPVGAAAGRHHVHAA